MERTDLQGKARRHFNFKNIAAFLSVTLIGFYVVLSLLPDRVGEARKEFVATLNFQKKFIDPNTLGPTPSETSDWGTLFTGPRAILQLSVDKPSTSDLELQFEFSVVPHAPLRDVDIFANGVKVGQWQLKSTMESQLRRVRITSKAWNIRNPIEILLVTKSKNSLQTENTKSEQEKINITLHHVTIFYLLR